MVRWLVLASVLWPALGAAAIWARASDVAAPWTTAVYVAASRICHQRPERSFHTAGVQWPVCGRCAGLYLGAAAGALLTAARRRRVSSRSASLATLGLAAVPTLATVLFEWAHVLPIDSVTRALAALPLGAAIAATLIGVAGSPAKAIR